MSVTMCQVNAAIRACAPEKYGAFRLAARDYRKGRISRSEMEAAIVLWQRSQPEIDPGRDPEFADFQVTPHGYIEKGA